MAVNIVEVLILTAVQGKHFHLDAGWTVLQHNQLNKDTALWIFYSCS